PGGAPLMLRHEVAIAGVLSLAALASLAAARAWPRLARTPADRALVVGPALVGVIAALPFLDVSDPQGLGFRLRLIAFVPLALSAAALAGMALARLTPAWRAAVLVPFVAGLLAARAAPPRDGVVTVHPAMQAA